MAYVEVKAKTVELAVEAAMRELGVTERGSVDVKVLQDPERGFLGIGGRDAIVKVERVESKSGSGGRRRQGSKGGSAKKGGQEGRKGGGGDRPKGAKPASSQTSRGGGDSKRNNSRSSGEDKKSGGKRDGGDRNGKGAKKKDEDREDLSVTSQEPLVGDFLGGLIKAFGLEGSVETRMEEDVIIANVVGDQTEALVGPRGSVMEAVHELTKTMLQRTVRDSARVRLDIAGYAERRRQALTIYAQGLIEQVTEDGGEIMLEPMSASDRKVIHDAVAQHDQVRSYSEGESPKRYVVIATTGDSSGEEE